jgi:tripartite-type tricarboxylate transporter receptor subunit TctC
VNLLAKVTGAEYTMVPYTGATPALTAVRGGHVETAILALGTMTGQLKNGTLRGILTSDKWPDFPDIPTLEDLGYHEPFFGIWTGFFAPAGVPAEVTRALVPALEHAIRAPAVEAKLKPLGILPAYASPEELISQIREEHRRVSEIARQTGLVK